MGDQIRLDTESLLSDIYSNSAGAQEVSHHFEVSSLPPTWKQASGPNHTPRTAGECMYQYCFYGVYYSDESKKVNMQEMLACFRRFEPSAAKREKEKQIADHWIEAALELLNKTLRQNASAVAPFEKKIKRMGEPLPYIYKRKRSENIMEKQRQTTLKTHCVQITAPAVQPQQIKPSIHVEQVSEKPSRRLVYDAHPNDIYALQPASAWHLYLDESGKDTDFSTGGNGIFAAVLEDAAHPLPAFPPLHAATDATEEKILAGDQVIDTLLHHPQTGVLAVPVYAYRNGAAWGSLIISCIDLVLRLLPLNGQKTKLTVLVEARDPYQTEKDFIQLRDACRYQLMHTLPERSSLIDFEIRAMDKTHPKNAYPDLVAHTCFTYQGNPVAKQRFRLSGWAGSCFLNYTARQICPLLDYLHLGRVLSVTDWNELVQKADAHTSGFITAALKSFGEELRQNVELWKTFLDYFVMHLNSKAINLHQLRKQADFLKTYQPVTEQLPPRLKLLWLTAKLAEENHRGSTDVGSMEEFNSLIERLYEEDAPLTCWATLHLAVNYTNAFDFVKAKELVEKYLSRIQQNKSPAAITGLQYYAQLISSRGQHEAFLGNQKKAVFYFRDALEHFNRLSTGGKDDQAQTGTYLLTSLMELEDFTPDAFQPFAEWYFGKDLCHTLERLVTGNADAEKYKHHLLYRWLLSGKAAADLKEKTLAQKENWLCGNGHPWEMIEFYRGILVENKEEKLNLFRHAYEMALEGGPTLHIIACVILGSIAYYDHSVVTELSELIEKTVAELPALGNERVSCLHCQCQQPQEPLTFAKAILPFNFR